MSQTFCHILVCPSLWCLYPVISSIVVVGGLRCCALLHSVSDLKATQMNVQHSLIQELLLYKFELGHKATEATKNICCAKDEGTVGHSMVTRWFKKFCFRCQNLDDQARSSRPKTMDSEAMLQARETNLVSSIRRVSGELGIS